MASPFHQKKKPQTSMLDINLYHLSLSSYITHNVRLSQLSSKTIIHFFFLFLFFLIFVNVYSGQIKCCLSNIYTCPVLFSPIVKMLGWEGYFNTCKNISFVWFWNKKKYSKIIDDLFFYINLLFTYSRKKCEVSNKTLSLWKYLEINGLFSMELVTDKFYCICCRYNLQKIHFFTINRRHLKEGYYFFFFWRKTIWCDMNSTTVHVNWECFVTFPIKVIEKLFG